MVREKRTKTEKRQAIRDQWERLSEILKEKRWNQKVFAEKVGLTPSAITRFKSGASGFSNETWEHLAKTLDCSVDWLVKNIGSKDIKYDNNLLLLQESKSSLESTINLAGDKSEIKIPNSLHNVLVVELPFVPIFSHSNFAENCKSINLKDLKTRSYPKHDRVDYTGGIAIEIQGNSMGARYSSGTEVLIKPVDRALWAQATGVHVLCVNGEVLIKRIKDNSILDTGRIVLYSDNPDYGSIIVSADDIQCMYKVGSVLFSPEE